MNADTAEITIHVEADHHLTVDDVFPDGAPDNWTIADVVAAVRLSGSPRQFLKDWELHGLDVVVEITSDDGRQREEVWSSW